MLNSGHVFGVHYFGSLKAIVNLKAEFPTSMNGQSVYTFVENEDAMNEFRMCVLFGVLADNE